MVFYFNFFSESWNCFNQVLYRNSKEIYYSLVFFQRKEVSIIEKKE